LSFVQVTPFLQMLSTRKISLWEARICLLPVAIVDKRIDSFQSSALASYGHMHQRENRQPVLPVSGAVHARPAALAFVLVQACFVGALLLPVVLTLVLARIRRTTPVGFVPVVRVSAIEWWQDQISATHRDQGFVWARSWKGFSLTAWPWETIPATARWTGDS